VIGERQRELTRGLIAAAVVATGLSGCVSIADHARPERLPIVDFHAHLNGDMGAEELVQLMDRMGVRTMVLMARYYANPRDAGFGSDEQAAAFARRYKGRFIPFIAGQRGEIQYAWEASERATADWYVQSAEQKLRSAEFFGLGEYIVYHHSYDLPGWGQTGGEVRLRLDTPLMHRLADLGATYGVPVLFHMEAEPEPTGQAIRLFDAHPETTFIWAHNCGRASAEQIRRLLARYSRLVCDLGSMMAPPEGRGVYGYYWPRFTPHIHLVQQPGGKVHADMLRLFEDFSDRFVLGTDVAHTQALRFYEERIYALRQVLSQMTPGTARRIAHENAERLFAERRMP